ncbi:hypothetical protein H6G89_24490 [Oscillatoria sp. FACHB-1407]|uniref:hypothetical protein n=1 Tax=Oscillatoria sp. FACHB-1407 TaxID=2692847 RepID=UPI00168836F6|nr:hypothetical protein [Oscillatoria sp. FACHB-1407]MBD2464165.1 hypothetical protein [Oscillatoria sp. FACHB-1407]
MDWLISLDDFNNLATARPEPPYFLLVAGLLIVLACALPLAIVVRQRMDYWAKNFSPNSLPKGGRLQVILPFSGVMGGICIAAASGLEILGVPVLPSLVFAAILTFLISYLAWSGLGRALSRRVLRSYFDQANNVSPGRFANRRG